MSDLPDYALDLINDVAKSEGFTDYTTELKPGSNHGDNFLGIMTSVTICGQRNNNDSTVSLEKLHLLCKLAPSNPIRRQEFRSVDVFRREAIMYNKILPQFKAFQAEKGLSDNDGFNSYPKCYAAIVDEEKDQFIVIMEDIRPKGFAMWPKRKTVLSEHSYAVVEQLAKFHAISFALKDQRPDDYAELKKLHDILSVFFYSGHMEAAFEKNLERTIKSLADADHIRVMNGVRGNLKKFFNDCHGDDVCEPFGVLGHGDCHNNNILYRHQEGTNKVIDVCLVDWQLARYCSPVLDLHYNIFSTTQKSFRDKEYKNLMKYYHTTLSNSIKKLGSDPDKLFTFDEFEGQLKKFGKFAFIWGPMLTNMMMADPNDIPDLDQLSEKLVENKGNIEFTKDFEGDEKTAYETRLRDLIGDLIDLDYYSN